MIYPNLHLMLVKTEDGEYIRDIYYPHKTDISFYHGICTTRNIKGGENVWLAFREMRKELDEYEKELKERDGRN